MTISRVGAERADRSLALDTQMGSYSMMENGGFQVDSQQDDKESTTTAFSPSETISPAVLPAHDVIEKAVSGDSELGLASSSSSCDCGPHCSRERLHRKDEEKRQRIELRTWTPCKGKILLAAFCSLLLWAIVYFTLSSFDYV